MKISRHLVITGIVCGALLTLAPLAGVLGTVLGMAREFNELSNAASMGGPPVASAPAGHTLIPTIVSILLCPVGVTLLIVSLKYHRRLSPETPSGLPTA